MTDTGAGGNTAAPIESAMAFLHIDGRGFFYLCESRRKGGRVVRKKLAYLGRMKVPDLGNARDKEGALSRDWSNDENMSNAGWMLEYRRLCYRLMRIEQGKGTPNFEDAYHYCHIVGDIVPRDRREARMVARARAARKVCDIGAMMQWAEKQEKRRGKAGGK